MRTSESSPTAISSVTALPEQDTCDQAHDSQTLHVTNMIVPDKTVTAIASVSELSAHDREYAEQVQDGQMHHLRRGKRKDHPTMPKTSTKRLRDNRNISELEQHDLTQGYTSYDLQQRALSHSDTTRRHEDPISKDKETSDIQDTSPDVDVNSVNSMCVVEVVSQKAMYPLHTQARTSPTHPGSPSSTFFDKHLVDS